MDLKTWCGAERGRASKLAAAIGVPVPFMSQMMAGDRPVPPQHGAAIEVATDRAVMRWDLRPDDWHRIWPELIGTDGAPAVAHDDSAAEPEEDRRTHSDRRTEPLSAPQTRADEPPMDTRQGERRAGR